MSTTDGRRRPTGFARTRSSRARWTGRTAISPRHSVPRKCDIGTGSTRAPSRARPVRCTRRSASGCPPRESGLGVRGSGVRPAAPEPRTPNPEPLMLRIRAQFVHPVTAPPIEDGAVLVDDRGTIAAVGPNLVVPTRPGALQLEFPDARLLPGLVNTHTHLELTHLAGKNAEREFAAWIRTLRALKDATTPEEFSRSAEQGVRDAWAAGVTCVADTGSTGAPLEALARLGGRGIYYQEVFGPDPAHCAASMAELEHALARLSPLASSPLSLGVSPHAPYTVSEPLYRAVADLAGRDALPLAVHLAESRAETMLVADGTGPFADALHARGFAVRAPNCPP